MNPVQFPSPSGPPESWTDSIREARGRVGRRLDLYDNSDFDRGANRWKEWLWVATKCVFFLNPIPWSSPLRVTLLRLFGAKIGRNVVIRAGVHVTFPWRLHIGDHVWLGDDVLILSLAQVRIGSHVCISQRAFLCTGSHAWRKETFDLITAAITIDDGAWIAAQAFIGPGVRIGLGSVAGAAAVVLKSVPAGSLVAGNPACVTSKTVS
jgi:putative colanic acid biosynthesis acetyltransferase WcaF